MSNITFPPVGSTVECALKIRDFLEIPMYEELTDELLFLMTDEQNEKRIREWMERSGIEIINYHKHKHKYEVTNEIVLDVFWYIVNKVIHAEESFRVAFYKNIFLNVVKKLNRNLDEIKSFIDIISEYSLLHIKVLRLINGIYDYYSFWKIPLMNTIPDNLAKCIEIAIGELRGKHEKYKVIWNDLLSSGLRKEASLHMWMNDRRFVWMSLLSPRGKGFLDLIYLSKPK